MNQWHLNKNLLCIFLTLGLFLFLASCEKDAGFGGTSTITGKVKVRDYNADFSVVNSIYWAQEEDVYLIFGNDSIYSEKFETNYDGSFWFQYLREGNYTVFAYSKDSTLQAPSGKVPVKVEVNVSKADQVVEAPTLTILN